MNVGGTEVEVGKGVGLTVGSDLIFVCGIGICVGIVEIGAGIDRGVAVAVCRGIRVSTSVETGTGVGPESIPPHDNIIKTSTDPRVNIIVCRQNETMPFI